MCILDSAFLYVIHIVTKCFLYINSFNPLKQSYELGTIIIPFYRLGGNEGTIWLSNMFRVTQQRQIRGVKPRQGVIHKCILTTLKLPFLYLLLQHTTLAK